MGWLDPYIRCSETPDQVEGHGAHNGTLSGRQDRPHTRSASSSRQSAGAQPERLRAAHRRDAASVPNGAAAKGSVTAILGRLLTKFKSSTTKEVCVEVADELLQLRRHVNAVETVQFIDDLLERVLTQGERLKNEAAISSNAEREKRQSTSGMARLGRLRQMAADECMRRDVARTEEMRRKWRGSTAAKEVAMEGEEAKEVARIHREGHGVVAASIPGGRAGTTTEDRHLMAAFKKLRFMADRIALTRTVRDAAEEIYAKIYETKALRGRAQEGTLAATLFLACQQEGFPRSFKEIARATSAPHGEVAKCFKKAVKALTDSGYLKPGVSVINAERKAVNGNPKQENDLSLNQGRTDMDFRSVGV
eukprot:SAG31_NODE_2733_length_5173_cov_2.072724_2_plen_364_part_00